MNQAEYCNQRISQIKKKKLRSCFVAWIEILLLLILLSEVMSTVVMDDLLVQPPLEKVTYVNRVSPPNLARLLGILPAARQHQLILGGSLGGFFVHIIPVIFFFPTSQIQHRTGRCSPKN